MSEENKEPVVLFNRKMNRIFGDVLAMDWEPDKGYELTRGGKTLRYVSIGKMKRQLGPCFQKNMVNINVDFTDLSVTNDDVSIKAVVTFTDVETGYSETTTAPGRSSKGDKALQIAQTYAFKSCLQTRFFIIDGIEPEEEECDAVKFKGSFVVKKTPEEVEEIKSKIDKLSIKPTETPKQETVNDAAPVKTEEPATVKEQPKTETPVEVKDTTPSYAYVPTGIEIKTISTIKSKWAAKHANKEVSDEQYNEMLKASEACKESKAKVLEFIKTYRVL